MFTVEETRAACHFVGDCSEELRFPSVDPRFLAHKRKNKIPSSGGSHGTFRRRRGGVFAALHLTNFTGQRHVREIFSAKKVSAY